MLNKVVIVLLTFLGAAPLVAQQSEEPAPETDPVVAIEELTAEEREKLIKECEARLEKLRNEEGIEQDDARGEKDPCEDLAIEASTEEFVPSEDISADNSISFPVDI